jgi:hypothetical protein
VRCWWKNKTYSYFPRARSKETLTTEDKELVDQMLIVVPVLQSRLHIPGAEDPVDAVFLIVFHCVHPFQDSGEGVDTWPQTWQGIYFGIAEFVGDIDQFRDKLEQGFVKSQWGGAVVSMSISVALLREATYHPSFNLRPFFSSTA